MVNTDEMKAVQQGVALDIARERIAKEAGEKTGELDLRSLGLSDLPDELFALTHLRVLRLGHSARKVDRAVSPDWGPNRVGGPKLAGLVRLPKLTALDLSGSGGSLEQIAKLAGLKSLSLARTTLTDIAPIAALTGLEELDISHTRVWKLEPLAGLRSLKRLNIERTRAWDITPIAALSGLTHLNISNNTELRSCAALAGLTNIVELLAFNTPCRLVDLTNLTALQRLDLAAKGLKDLTSIGRFTKLQWLKIADNSIRDLTPLARLSELRELDVSLNPIEDLTPVAELVGLTRLNARKTRVRTLPRSLGALRTLETGAISGSGGLELDGSPLTDPLPQLIAPGQPQATINVLAWLRGELDANALPGVQADDIAVEDPPPSFPPQGAGMHIVLDESARLVPAPPGSLDRDGNHLPRLRGLHPSLREAAGDLVESLAAGNRPHPLMLKRAEAYRARIDLPLDEINFPELFAEGVRIDNAARRVSKAVQDGRLDTPPLPLAAEEALDTILQLHPGFIAASRDGAEMIVHQTTVHLTAEDLPVLAEAAGTIAAELARRPDLAAPEVPASIADAAAEIAASPNPGRDAMTTIAMSRNAVIGIGQCAVTAALVVGAGGLAAVFVGGVAPVAVIGAVGLAGYKSVEKTKHFEELRTYLTFRQEALGDGAAEQFVRGLRGHRDLMLRSEPTFRRLARVPGFDWLNGTLDWLKRQSPLDPPQ
jgi:Leucine-rich repeat (LRR) protein